MQRRALLVSSLSALGGIAHAAPPTAWFWSHDIEPDQVGAAAMPGWRMLRLAAYGEGKRLRYAAVLHQGWPARRWHLALDAAAAQALAREPGLSLVGITVLPDGRFTLLSEAGAASALHLGLDADGVQRLLAEGRRILDFCADGARYAVLTVPSATPGAFAAGDAASLIALARSRRQQITRLRNGAAALEPAGGTRWGAAAGLTADEVARKLEQEQGWPVDLDAARTPAGVRFNLVFQAK